MSNKEDKTPTPPTYHRKGKLLAVVERISDNACMSKAMGGYDDVQEFEDDHRFFRYIVKAIRETHWQQYVQEKDTVVILDIEFESVFENNRQLLENFHEYCRMTGTKGYCPITATPVDKEVNKYLLRYLNIKSCENIKSTKRVNRINKEPVFGTFHRFDGQLRTPHIKPNQ